MTATVIHATIAPGDVESGAVDCRGGTVAMLKMPGEWTGALLSFLASTDGSEFFPLVDYTGEALAINVKPDSYVLVPAEWSSAVAFLKLVSGTAENTVPQNEMCVFQVVVLDALPEEPPAR